MEKAIAAGAGLLLFLVINSYIGLVAPTGAGILPGVQT